MFYLVSEIPFSSSELILNKNSSVFISILICFTSYVFQVSCGFCLASLSKGLDFEEGGEEAGTDEDLNKCAPRTCLGFFHSS